MGMKGKLIFCLVAMFSAAFWPLHVFAATPKNSAQSAVLVNQDSGSILYAKNENEHHAIASTTKIMTAFLTLEAAEEQNREITVMPEMIRVEGSSMGLRVGNRLTLHDLAVGMMMVSGNDAANAAAIAIGGSTERFAAMMNAKAASLGMSNTHFVTPSGLDDTEHYSTARDMAVLACAAMQNSNFASIVRQKSMKIHFLNPDEIHSYGNHNKLLQFYPSCTGIKTGFTKKAGRCLVSAAEKDGVRLVAVTLDDPDDWNDHEALLDYGFSQLKSQKIDDSSCRLEENVVGGIEPFVTVSGTEGEKIVIGSSDHLTRTVELPQFLYAPVKTGQVVGCVRYDCGGKTVARTELVAEENVARAVMPKNWFQVFWDGLKRLLFG